MSVPYGTRLRPTLLAALDEANARNDVRTVDGHDVYLRGVLDLALPKTLREASPLVRFFWNDIVRAIDARKAYGPIRCAVCRKQMRNGWAIFVHRGWRYRVGLHALHRKGGFRQVISPADLFLCVDGPHYDVLTEFLYRLGRQQRQQKEREKLWRQMAKLGVDETKKFVRNRLREGRPRVLPLPDGASRPQAISLCS